MAQNDEKMRQDLARKQAETEMEVEREQVCEKRLAEEIRDGIHNALRTMR